VACVHYADALVQTSVQDRQDVTAAEREDDLHSPSAQSAGDALSRVIGEAFGMCGGSGE
jgi:hypothetical protein